MPFTEDDEQEYCSIFRSAIDDRVWMCNIPYVDVAAGLVASTSLRKLKQYVEEVADRSMHYGNGTWVHDPDPVDGGWSYYPEAASDCGRRRGRHA